MQSLLVVAEAASPSVVIGLVVGIFAILGSIIATGKALWSIATATTRIETSITSYQVTQKEHAETLKAHNGRLHAHDLAFARMGVKTKSAGNTGSHLAVVQITDDEEGE